MKTQTVTANVTFASQAHRDAAKTRVESALAAYTWKNRANALTSVGGLLTPTTTTLQVSIEVDETLDADDVARDIFSALTQSNRHTSGWVSTNRVP